VGNQTTDRHFSGASPARRTLGDFSSMSRSRASRTENLLMATTC
jgi:hypothetical protein